MNKKTVLVTGGCGFIGSHLVEGLVKKGYRVRILDNLLTGKVENLASIDPKDVEMCVGDVKDFSSVDAIVEGCEYVFHQAAIVSVIKSIDDPVGTGKVNYGGTINVLEAARKHNVRRVVFAGSAAVYGDEPTLPKNELMQPMPINPYAVDKLASEFMGQVYTRLFGIEFVSLRYFNVFGSRQDPLSPYSGVISIFCHQIRQGFTPTIYGDGFQSRDFIHVSDIVEANLTIMECPNLKTGIFNVGRGSATTLLDVLNEINYLTGQNLQPIHKDVRLGDVRHSFADNTALKALGWSPLISIREGLTELLNLKC